MTPAQRCEVRHCFLTEIVAAIHFYVCGCSVSLLYIFVSVAYRIALDVEYRPYKKTLYFVVIFLNYLFFPFIYQCAVDMETSIEARRDRIEGKWGGEGSSFDSTFKQEQAVAGARKTSRQ